MSAAAINIAKLEATSDTEAFASRDAEPTWQQQVQAALLDVKAKLNATSTGTSQPMFMDASELFQREYPAAPWLVTGLVTRGGTAIISGEPKTSKTWLAIEIALSIATGTKVCGEFFAEQGRAAYFFAEDLDKQVRNRLRALLAGRGNRTMPVGRLFVQPRGKFIDVLEDQHLAWIIASCRKLGHIDLLVLDPLRDIHSGEEDKSDSMRDVMRRLRVLGEVLGCTVAATHHNAKATGDTSKRRPGQRGRGSSAIHGSTDSGIYLSSSDGDGTNVFRNVVDAEIKGARSAGQFTAEITIEDDTTGEAISATWSVSRESGRATAKQTAKAKALAGDDATVFAFVRTLAMRGEAHSRRGLRDHDERPIPEKRFRDALDRLIDTGQLVLSGSDVRIPQPTQGDDR
jgi:hypothetical protein